MLYTTVPLERIYSCRTESILINTNNRGKTKEENETNEFKNISLQHGRIYAKRDGDHYVVDGISSTDMSDYLNSEYIPGSIIN